MPAGRPSKYSKELADKILQEMKDGDSLPEACAKHDVHRGTFWRWTEEHEHLRDALTRAREARCWTRFENMRAIAFDESRDYFIDDKGIRRSDNTAVQRDKLKLEQEWRELRALLPKIFNEKWQMELSGPNGGGIPIAVIREIEKK